jgi:predicted regulator of Ras-like GTPase activity (Roadblock/LC7/MglB family)
MIVFERFNPSIQAEVVVSIDGLLVEKEKKFNMFGVGATME